MVQAWISELEAQMNEPNHCPTLNRVDERLDKLVGEMAIMEGSRSYDARPVRRYKR